VSTADLDAWQPMTPDEVGRRFHGIAAPWCIVGGQAIDLWLGRQTRAHDDIEISILREDLGQFRAALPECEFYAAGSGQVTFLGAEQPTADIHQVWCLDRELKNWRLDIMIEPGTRSDGGYATWRYRREASIQLARDLMTLTTTAGVPFMRPDCVLLFKAKYMREKDQADFQAVLDRLPDCFEWFVSPYGELEWLEGRLEELHPTHEWLIKLRSIKNLTI
jgi:hypothetical protein